MTTQQTAAVEAPGPAHLWADPGVAARRWWILAVLCLSLLVVSIDNTILNVALPSLVRELHATSSDLQWFVDGYTLVFASFLLTAGSLGDRFGRKGALQIGLLVFGVGSLASAFSGSSGALIATRSLTGLGGAFIMPTTLSILDNVFSPEERGRAIAVWAGVAGLGVAIGPVSGGLLLQHFWWGSVFLVNVPVVAVALVAGWLLVPKSRDPHPSRLDPLGTVLSIAGLTGVLYGIIEGPAHGWTSSEILGAFVVGGLLLGIFVVWELRIDHPMLDVRFFENPRFSAASLAVMLVFFALAGSLYFLTQYLQDTLGYNPLEAGLRVAPVAFTLMAASTLSPRLVRSFGTKITVATGLGVAAAALLALSAVSTTSGYGLVFVVLLLLGVGMGLAMAPATDSIMGSLPPERAGVGSAVNDTTRQIGGALGVAILGSILASQYRSSLSGLTALKALPSSVAAAATNSIGGALSVAAHLPAGPAHLLTQAANASFINAMTTTVIVGAAVAGAGALLALVFLPARPAVDTAHVEDLDDLVVATAQRLPASPRSIFDATLALLGEGGFASLSYAGIATRSGVPCSTIERQWSSKVDLVIDAVNNLRAPVRVTDSGSVSRDCRAFLRAFIANLADPTLRSAIVSLVGAAGRDPGFARAFQQRLVAPRRHELLRLLEEAQQRGELPPGADPDLLADLLAGPLFHRLLVTGEPITPELADELVDLVVEPQLLAATR